MNLSVFSASRGYNLQKTMNAQKKSCDVPEYKCVNLSSDRRIHGCKAQKGSVGKTRYVYTNNTLATFGQSAFECRCEEEISRCLENNCPLQVKS